MCLLSKNEVTCNHKDKFSNVLIYNQMYKNIEHGFSRYMSGFKFCKLRCQSVCGSANINSVERMINKLFET